MRTRNLSDTERKLLDRWRSHSYDKPALREILIEGGGLRILSKGFDIEFPYPVTAVAGENGTGKSTILACAACAYHNNSDFVPRGLRAKTPYYTFGQFFVNTRFDNPRKHPVIVWMYSGNKNDVSLFWARKRHKWSKYHKRPHRVVQWVGISRVLPAVERNVLQSHFGGSKALRGRRYEANEIERISRVLGRRYTFVGRALSKKYSMHACDGPARCSAFNVGAGEDTTFEIVDIMETLPEGSLLLIEEIETGLHPYAQAKLVREILELSLERHIQVIFTTHSNTILETLPPIARILLVRRGNEIKAHYEVTTEFAFSMMSERPLPELTVYVEDAVSKAIICECLPNPLRRRLRVVSVGSWTTLISQLAAIRRDPDLGKCIAVFDGDKSVNELKQAFNSNIGRKAREEDIDWLTDHIAFLPGGVEPERWILSLFNNSGFIKNFSESTLVDSGEAISIFESISCADIHDIFYECSNRFGMDSEEIRGKMCAAAVRVAKDDFQPVIAQIENLLK